MLNIIRTPILIAVLAQTPPDGAKPSALPDSPAFREPGVTVATVGRNLWVAIGEKGRRVIVRASVCRKDVFLEEFMCLKNSKEHESILAADIHAKTFHAALLLAGAEPGSVAKFQPQFQPPTGDKLDIWVEWKQGKETKRVKAQEWIRDGKTKKAITHDFVFAGSGEIKHPVTGESYYLGNEGDLISVSNFASSVIDLAVQSSNVDEELAFESFAERVPPVDTEVFVILQPVPKPKDRAKRDERVK